MRYHTGYQGDLTCTAAPSFTQASSLHASKIRVVRQIASSTTRFLPPRIELVATGYLPWSRDNVVVTADRCHVTPVSVQASLTPAT